MSDSPTPIREAFDPARHLSRVNGAAYLDVEHRIAWFRDRFPDGRIETDLLDHGPGWAIFRAAVTAIGEGGVLSGRATGHGSETADDFRDYLEKAETKAIGRALAALGFGTQFVINHEDGAPRRVVEAPVAIRNPAPAPPPAQRPAAGTPAPHRPDPAPDAPDAPRPSDATPAADAMTERQRRYLEAVARAAGLDANQLDDLAVQRFSAPYRWLSRQDASALITELQQRRQAAS